MSKIHLLSESSVEWLKQQAKALKKSKSIKFSHALYEISVRHGFSGWKDLVDVFKYESSQDHVIRHIEYDHSQIDPFQEEAEILKRQILSSQGITNDCEENFYDSILHADVESRRITASKHGFRDWSELSNKNIKQKVIQEFTFEQKIGSIARHLGVNPSSIKNTIHVSIDSSNEFVDIEPNQWEILGFYPDLYFSGWLEKNDPYFIEVPPDNLFRLIGADTDNYSEVQNHLDSVARRLNLFFPLIASNIWINGKVDMTQFQEDLDEELNVFGAHVDYLLPLAELPEAVWKRGY